MLCSKLSGELTLENSDLQMRVRHYHIAHVGILKSQLATQFPTKSQLATQFPTICQLATQLTTEHSYSVMPLWSGYD